MGHPDHSKRPWYMWIDTLGTLVGIFAIFVDRFKIW